MSFAELRDYLVSLPDETLESEVVFIEPGDDAEIHRDVDIVVARDNIQDSFGSKIKKGQLFLC